RFKVRVGSLLPAQNLAISRLTTYARGSIYLLARRIVDKKGSTIAARRQGDRRSVEWLCRRDGRRLRACWLVCDGCQGSGESGCWRAGRRAVCERTGRAGRPEPLLG